MKETGYCRDLQYIRSSVLGPDCVGLPNLFANFASDTSIIHRSVLTYGKIYSKNMFISKSFLLNEEIAVENIE
jgi:hypothetical protein